MKKISKIVTLFFFLVLGLGISSIAEEITLTTYYPAPYGAYEELRAKRMAVGTNYLDASTVTVGDDNLIVEGSVGIGIASPGGKLTVVPDANGRGVEVISPSAGNTHFPWTNNWNYISGNGVIFRNSSMAEKMRFDATSGSLGIGIANPTATLHVNGNIKAVLNDIDGASPANMRYNSGTDEIGYDVAELFDTSREVEVGDVLVIDETEDLKLRKSHTPYEKGIIGIVSGSPAILFEGSQLEIAPPVGGFTKGTKPPVALAGRIPCKVSLENGTIERGDLLTSSSTPGHAMKATDRDKSFGAVLGKALEPFNGGPEGEKTGKIIVLVTLQ
ncbi:MAG: hypothetical protein KJ902_01080 [Candidatus Omnitrophica bacterium]|nr:hypothetical protein [Candidatus Omnitrophota bacterium]MBU4457313.1 hypothetical protein [Candidatus Omnitrophota bacterium]